MRRTRAVPPRGGRLAAAALPARLAAAARRARRAATAPRALLAAALLFAPLAARAELPADVLLIEGSDWRRVLPVVVSAAAPAGRDGRVKLPPILLVAPGEERWTEETLARLRAGERLLWLGDPLRPDPALDAVLRSARRLDFEDGALDDAVVELGFPKGARAARVYLSDGRDPAAALAAALLAAQEHAPLLVASGAPARELAEALALAVRLHATELVVAGAELPAPAELPASITVRTLDADALLRARAVLLPRADELVVAGPGDLQGLFAPPRLALLAAPLALARGAPVAFTRRDRPLEAALAAVEAGRAQDFTTITLVGDGLAVPLASIEDLDQKARGVARPRVHRLAPFADPDGPPPDRAVGRLAALDAYDLSRWVARLLHVPHVATNALVLANADEKFILGEAMSRTTVEELRRAGLPTEAHFREAITRELLRTALAGPSLVLWEGHPRDLTLDDDALPVPETSLPGAAFFLQGCYTLDRSDPYVLVERGADAVIGTHMAVYSASGSSFARAFLTAQLHRGLSAGDAMAAARRYLLAVVALKQRRGHDDWRKTLRAAVSFDLFGDPRAPPVVAFGRGVARPPIAKGVLVGGKLRVTVPPGTPSVGESGSYEASVRPGAQLSAIYRVKKNEGRETTKRRLVELHWIEVTLPRSFGAAPKLTAPLPDGEYAWVFAPRSRTLSVLVTDRAFTDPALGGTIELTVTP